MIYFEDNLLEVSNWNVDLGPCIWIDWHNELGQRWYDWTVYRSLFYDFGLLGWWINFYHYRDDSTIPPQLVCGYISMATVEKGRPVLRKKVMLAVIILQRKP